MIVLTLFDLKENDLLINYQPDWITLMFLSAIVGVLVGNVFKVWNVFVYFYKLLIKKVEFEGLWYSYHWSYKDSTPLLVCSEITISKGIKHSFKIKLHQNTELAYKGYGDIEEGQIIFTLKSNDDIAETTFIRLHRNLRSKKAKTNGLWLSYNHDKLITSGAIVLSRNQISENQIDNEIKSQISCKPKYTLITTK